MSLRLRTNGAVETPTANFSVDSGWPPADAFRRQRRRGRLKVGVTSPTDRELLTAVARQERAAFETLCRRFGHRIFGFLLARVPGQEAEELVQEVMLTVWTRATSYDPTLSAPSTWIFTIARNKAIDRARKRMRPKVDPNDPTLIPDPTAPAPDRRMEILEWGTHIDAALRALPEAQRAVVTAAYVEERSMREIAERQGVPLGTVKSRMRLALKSLRNYFQEREDIDAHRTSS